ncbi:MAG: hypothetical protein IJ692_00920 [Alloprevotella sp.]|nr:hypothetical protein [Alloprevotella sp.]
MKLLRHILPLLLALCTLPLAAQQAGGDLRSAVQAYFSNYSQTGFRPMRPVGYDSLIVDDESALLDIYANEAFSSQTFTPETVRRIYGELQGCLPEPYNKYHVTLFCRGGEHTVSSLIPNVLRTENVDKRRQSLDCNYTGKPWMKNISRPYLANRGLEGRHVMVTPSHGRFYRNQRRAWEWQRPYLFCTTEDFFTQSFVNPFVLPMLEKAGAVAVSAKERDYQTAEAIVDNDTPASGGSYEEQGLWSTTDVSGFSMPQGNMRDGDNPFTTGTTRGATAEPSATSSVTWTPDIPRRGSYAVYISYPHTAQNVDDAHYTVRHLGGTTRFVVNQQMGGGTWLYLGTFEFAAGQNPKGCVTLTNESAANGGIVVADAVRFGGGMGRNVRGSLGTTGLPRYLEGARSYAQWSGAPYGVYAENKGDNDYKDDIRTRGNYANWLAGGSVYRPNDSGLGVPLETSIAVHSDAGYRKDNTVYGTLGLITTIDYEKRRNYTTGLPRVASSDLANLTLLTLQRDLSQLLGMPWTRREVWDRDYAESRMPDMPSMILETMSHQNYGDLKYGHDPIFKFTLARSLYKSILRFVNMQHGRRDVTVQPLPPRAFSATLDESGQHAILRWEPTEDALEPTAVPTRYIVYTRRDDGGFDNGQVVEGTAAEADIKPGVRYSFRIAALNEGGESFPSETLCVYRAPNEKHRVLIVNGFNRLSGPARVETAERIGFDLRQDVGVPYQCTTAFAGYQSCFDARQGGKEGAGALGFGGSELTGVRIAGNTFDFPALHGEAMTGTEGISFCSMSKEAALAADWNRYDCVDYICGLERNASYNLRPFKTFDAATRGKMEAYGGALFVSGAFVGSDMQESAEERDFCERVLHFTHAGSLPNDGSGVSGEGLSFQVRSALGEDTYAVQHYDALQAVDPQALTPFCYQGTGQAAGVAYRNGVHRPTLTLGFPFESITQPAARREVMGAALKLLGL